MVTFLVDPPSPQPSPLAGGRGSISSVGSLFLEQPARFPLLIRGEGAFQALVLYPLSPNGGEG